jgi:hypothetical protein
MVNHLARGDEDKRLEQCKLLSQWAKGQTLPVIAVGDYNIDFHVTKGDAGKRDPGFDALLKDNHFRWVRPDRLTKTQASDNYNSVLDFVFVAHAPFGWSAQSRILNREDDEGGPGRGLRRRRPEHRPPAGGGGVHLPLRPGRGGRRGAAAARTAAGPAPKAVPANRDDLRGEIADLKRRLKVLERQLEQLDP